MTCFHCRYFVGYLDKGGSCRFNPPVVVADGSTVFPHVAAGSSCGQFQPRHDAPAAPDRDYMDALIDVWAATHSGIRADEIAAKFPDLSREQLEERIARDLVSGRLVRDPTTNRLIRRRSLFGAVPGPAAPRRPA